MNKFTPFGGQVIDSAGNTYATDTWHPTPVPNGITENILNGNFWLVRSPIPPLPEPIKTQKEADSAEFVRWAASTGSDNANATYPSKAWHAALAWERDQREGEK